MSKDFSPPDHLDLGLLPSNASLPPQEARAKQTIQEISNSRNNYLVKTDTKGARFIQQEMRVLNGIVGEVDMQQIADSLDRRVLPFQVEAAVLIALQEAAKTKVGVWARLKLKRIVDSYSRSVTALTKPINHPEVEVARQTRRLMTNREEFFATLAKSEQPIRVFINGIESISQEIQPHVFDAINRSSYRGGRFQTVIPITESVKFWDGKTQLGMQLTHDCRLAKI